MISRKILVIAAIMYSVSVPMLANAKQPHPVQPEPAPGVDFCDCSAFTPVPDSDMYESYCSVQWTTTGNYWPAYGASIEYEAEWMEDDSEMSVGSETEIEEYSCVFGADDVCNANDVHVVIDGHPEEAEVEFQAKVKGFDNKGEGSRDFVKVTGDCSID